VIIGGAIGAVLGYFRKCFSGSRRLPANAYLGAICGAVLGALLTSVLWPKSQESPGSSHIIDVNSESDLNAGEPKENGSRIVESLTKDSFLQKVFDYEQNKEWKFEGELPCIIDFYADWCGPCKMVEPILQELAQEYQGKVNIYRVDTQAQQELAAVFGIQSIPSILFVPLNGKPQMAVGALPKNNLEKAIEEVLKVE
jgi:thioredoxin